MEVAECEYVKIRKARKRHTCCECGTTIQPGQHYEYYSGIWSFGPDAYKTCLDCVELRNALADPENWGRFTFMELVEAVQEKRADEVVDERMDKFEERWKSARKAFNEVSGD